MQHLLVKSILGSGLRISTRCSYIYNDCKRAVVANMAMMMMMMMMVVIGTTTTSFRITVTSFVMMMAMAIMIVVKVMVMMIVICSFTIRAVILASVTVFFFRF